MSDRLNQVRLFLGQGSYRRAEEFSSLHLSQNPEDPEGHALRSMALLGMERPKEAFEEATKALQLDPLPSQPHYLLAASAMQLGDLDVAENALAQALERDPGFPHHWCLWGMLEGKRKRWKAMLEKAEKGLSLDPEDRDCALLKADALIQLRRRKEADEVLRGVMDADPTQAGAFLSKGWICLEERNPKKALAFFKEAARLEPENPGGRQGILVALKAHNPVYWVILSYYLFMARLGSRTQWFIIIGLFILSRIAASVGKSNPDLAPAMTVILWAYGIFVFLTWTADPLSNLALRLHPIGKYALSPMERLGSTLILPALGIAGILALLGWLIPRPGLFLGTVGFLILVIPISATFRHSTPRNLWIMGLGTVVLALLLTASVLLGFSGTGQSAAVLFALFSLGVLVTTILSNILLSRER